MVQREVPKESSQALIFCLDSAEIYPMRIRQLIAPHALICSLAILTGCHLSLIPSPAPSMAVVPVSAGGLLGVHLLIASAAKSLKPAGDTPRPTAFRAHSASEQTVLNSRCSPRLGIVSAVRGSLHVPPPPLCEYQASQL